jgi:hypothetical protein
MTLPPKPPEYAIYPAIGVARVGDSDEYYFGPDTPIRNLAPVPFTLPMKVVTTNSGKFRDSAGRIRRQAARFHVYKVTWRKYNDRTWVPDDPIEEVTAANGIELRWSVSVANRKSFTAYADASSKRPPPLEQRLEASARGQIGSVPLTHKDLVAPSDSKRPFETTLAQLLIDLGGRLVVLAGNGLCRPKVAGAKLYVGNGGLFQPNWFDDVCDGSVECEVWKSGAKLADALPAWVVTGKPSWTHAIPNVVSLYDVAEAIGVARGLWPMERKVSFRDELEPMLFTLAQHTWTSEQVSNKHAAFTDFLLKHMDQMGDTKDSIGESYRQRFFPMLSRPLWPPHSYWPQGYIIEDNLKALDENFDHALGRATPRETPRSMPAQAITTYMPPQFYRMWALSHNEFKDDLASPAPALVGPRVLDQHNRAHMGAMVGGSTMPGIEVGWRSSVIENWGMAFRLDQTTLLPGHFTATLSVPWPKDYSACTEFRGEEFWPAARPMQVLDAAGNKKPWARGWDDTADSVGEKRLYLDWTKLGFIVKHASGEYRESERTLP